MLKRRPFTLSKKRRRRGSWKPRAKRRMEAQGELTIVCPGCKRELFYLLVPFAREMPLFPEYLEPVDDSVPLPGEWDPCRCPFCREPYVRIMMHTQKGWI